MRYLFSWLVYGISYVFYKIGMKFLCWHNTYMLFSSTVQGKGRGPWGRMLHKEFKE